MVNARYAASAYGTGVIMTSMSKVFGDRVYSVPKTTTTPN